MDTRLVLFFDCFIISGDKTHLDEYQGAQKISWWREILDIREVYKKTSYKYISKIDVVKYVLTSYAAIEWDYVVVRYECENIHDSHLFHDFVHQLFPNAVIQKERSDTAQKFHDALIKLQHLGNPWIFFCPNNDHPFIGNAEDIAPTIAQACEIEKYFPEHRVTIQYSHFTESQTYSSFFQADWGAYRDNFNSVIAASRYGKAVETSCVILDSIQIFRLNLLLDLLSSTKVEGRLIRLEDTEFQASKIFKQIMILPSNEWCRHYDGIPTQTRFVPPLFVPPGFFSFDVKIRFGYPDYLEGWVNVNPSSDFIYLGGCSDLRCFLFELPKFWESRISTVDKNQLYKLSSEDLLDSYENLYEIDIERCNFYNLSTSAARVLRTNQIDFQDMTMNINRHPLLVVGQEILFQLSTAEVRVLFIKRGAVAFGESILPRGRYILLHRGASKKGSALAPTELFEVVFCDVQEKGLPPEG